MLGIKFGDFRPSIIFLNFKWLLVQQEVGQWLG